MIPIPNSASYQLEVSQQRQEIISYIPSPSVCRPAPDLLMIFQRWQRKWKESWSHRRKSSNVRKQRFQGNFYTYFLNLHVSNHLLPVYTGIYALSVVFF